jgi:DNA polymerase III epsilon subunit-like protein
MSDNIIFIDFEACSLSDDSWPIEVGIAWIDEKGKLRSSAKLIKPHTSWPADVWSERSEKIHGISREQLEVAEEAEDVARWLVGQIGDACVLSDAAEYDGRWMRCLLAAIDRDGDFEVLFIQERARSRFEQAAMSMFYKAHANGRSLHRAGEDALDLAQAWRAALKKERYVRDRS